MAAYRPPQTPVTARVHTAAGVVRGTFHIPARHLFIDHLSSKVFWNLTDVSLPGHDEPLPFFSLRAASAALVIPETALSEPVVTPAERRRIACLLDVGTVTGDIDLLRGTRVSDFAAQHGGFLTLREAQVAGEHAWVPIVMVNSAWLIGVSEQDAAEPAEALTQQRNIYKT